MIAANPGQPTARSARITASAPKCTTRAAISADPTAAAAAGMSFMPRRRHRWPAAARRMPDSARPPRPGQQARAQQRRVEIGRPAGMLGDACLDQAAPAEAVEKDGRLGRREVPPAIGGAAAPDGGDEAADRPPVMDGGDTAPPPCGSPTAARLVPRHPIDKKNDVAGLLAQQRVEQRQHRVWQKAGAAGDHKDAEPEKRIEAFAIAEIDKGR